MTELPANTIPSTGTSYASAASGYDPLSGIDWGAALSDTSVSVYFAPAGQRADGYTSEGFNAYEISRFMAAFAMIEELTNLTFDRVYSRALADFKLLLDTNEIRGDFFGYFNPPGEYNAGVGVFDGTLWDRTQGGDLETGGYGFVTITHELLHGLGLAHPHDDGGTSSIFPGVTSEYDDYGPQLLNQGVFTTMSYNTGFHVGPTGTSADPLEFADWGYEAGPMALDIAMLQALYGANTSTRTGNDTYVLPDASESGTAYRAIWDAGGIDTIEHSGSRDVTVNLRPASVLYEKGGGGAISAADGIAGGYTIASGVLIENAKTATGNDIVTGNAGANRIATGGGEDLIRAGNGADVIFGGTQADQIYAGVRADVVHGGKGADVVWLGGGGDLFEDHVQGGTQGRDTVFGGNGNDRMNGRGGDDLFYGEADDDTLLGGADDDLLVGGAGRDILKGQAGDDTLRGGSGRDTLHGGIGGDTLTGGIRADTFIFADRGGQDRVTDFQVGVDVLHLDADLWGGAPRTASQIVDMARITASGVEFDFGGGNVLLLEGITSTSGLDGSILV